VNFFTFTTDRQYCGYEHCLKYFLVPDQTLLGLIKKFGTDFSDLEKFLSSNSKPLASELSQLKLLAPIPHPPSMRDGYAFRQHVETARKNRGLEMIPEFDEFPVFYFTNHQAITGPGEVVVQQLHLDKLDYELEVAIVIGKEGRNIPVSKADEHIFGYTIMNDWSARGLQMQEMKLNLGPAKGKDFATSIGPYLVTRNKLIKLGKITETPKGEILDAAMKAFVNGKQYSQGNTNQMNWTFAQLIERASYGVTLFPGDIIGSGTVGTGCFLELNGSKITNNLWLKPGDEVVLEVEGLGKLINKICLQKESAGGFAGACTAGMPAGGASDNARCAGDKVGRKSDTIL